MSQVCSILYLDLYVAASDTCLTGWTTKLPCTTVPAVAHLLSRIIFTPYLLPYMHTPSFMLLLLKGTAMHVMNSMMTCVNTHHIDTSNDEMLILKNFTADTGCTVRAEDIADHSL